MTRLTTGAKLALLSLPLAAACRAEPHLGRVPVGLVELYDVAEPTGVMELEIARDGTLVEVEAEVPPAAVPNRVRSAVESRAPGARITGAERELNAAGEMWELQVVFDGRNWEFVIDEAGEVYETEKQLFRHEAPPEVLHAAERAVPESHFKSVEIVERRGAVEYHVKQLANGASYKVVLAADGTVLRAVREARAEIEIPLRPAAEGP